MTSDTTPDRPRAKSIPTPWRFIIGFAILVAVMATLGWVVESVTASRGMINATVLRTGTTAPLRCSPRILPVKEWICRTESIEWSGKGLPPKVTGQQPPYRILASSDLSGQQVQVTSHPERRSGRSLPGQAREVLVAAGHPVGTPMGAITFLVPLTVGAGFLVVLVWAAMKHRRFRRRYR